MKTSHLTVVLTLTCLVGLGMSARAEDGSSVVVSVPFELLEPRPCQRANTTSALFFFLR
jgi:hypothetical protein